MISYNPNAWFTFIFRFHKADTLRKLFTTIIGIAIYTVVVVFIEKNILHIEKTSRLNNFGIVHTILGFVISMLLVFRTNTAYERWWDGRKLWGQLVNCNRNLAIKVAANIPKEEQTELKLIIISFAYSLKNHLRGTNSDKEEDIRNIAHLLEGDKTFHQPLAITKLMYERLGKLTKAGILNNAQTLIINAELQQWMEICGACERIKNTPIPFSYSVFIKKFIFFYVMSLPLAMTFSLGYYSIAVVVFIFYVLASMELIAEEIENPFGVDENDLPLGEICRNINKSISAVL